MSEQGGRYQRSTSGLVGAMVVTLLVIGAFVAFRAISREELVVEPEPVDYLASVTYAQDGGYDVVYPARLPDGWIARSVDLAPGQRPAWGLGLLTADGKFVGVRQEDTSLDDLLTTYVDPDTTELAPVRVSGSVAPTWQRFEDEGGDRAYAATVGDDIVLVYGSATERDLLTVVEQLTTARRSD